MIKSAEVELTRPPILRGESDVEKSMFESLKKAQEENQKSLIVELQLLRAAQQFFGKQGFYGMALQGRRQEPWAENASLLFVWLCIAFKNAGMNVPKRSKISERSPMVKVIREALLWTGYGDRGLSTVAQSLKRERAPEPPEAGIVPLVRTALVESALMRTKRK